VTGFRTNNNCHTTILDKGAFQKISSTFVYAANNLGQYARSTRLDAVKMKIVANSLRVFGFAILATPTHEHR
jgi:hypothetical protein